MTGVPASKLHGALSRFERRAKKRNEPLEAFRETQEFAKLQGYFAGAFIKQVGFAVDNLEAVMALFNDAYSADEQKARLGKWFVENMPRLEEFISETNLYLKLVSAFAAAVRDQYLRLGVVMKAENAVHFDLSNKYYQAALRSHANYLLSQKSKIDETTRGKLISTIIDSRGKGDTIDETGALINDTFPEINSFRSFMIANTEANQAMSTGQLAFLKESGVPTKVWVAAGPSTCAICEGNEDDGEIPVNDTFSSGDEAPPAHPNCECYLDGGEIDLDSIDIWTGD